MKQYLITEHPKLIKKYLVEGKNKKDAYNNFTNALYNLVYEDEYQERHKPLIIEEVKKERIK